MNIKYEVKKIFVDNILSDNFHKFL